MEDTIDLFEHYETLPKNVQRTLARWGDKLYNDQTYDNCAKFLKAMEKHGYTFDYYLDAQPYNLRKIN
jgi:hypothetical protein